MALFGAIEAGGTKFVCGVGTGPDDLVSVRIPTGAPSATVASAVAWLREHAGNELAGVGIGSFGPLDRKTGHITGTPKAAWRNYDLAGEVRRALGVRVAFDTDVNAALLGEARWGAAQGVSDCIYLTIGTGIGGGALTGGRLVHGASHPEMGHIFIPSDGFGGVCPYHGNCLEGLASGPAIEARWGAPASALPPEHPAWDLEARFLATAIVNLSLTLAPKLILLGGGVMEQSHLFEMIRENVHKLAAGYVTAPRILPPGLGSRAGILGAIVLAAEIR